MRLSSRLSPLVVALAAPVAVAVPAAPAEAADNVLCEEYAVEDDIGEATARHVPYDLLGVPEAHELFERRGRVPGAGVRVAVVDSGIAPKATDIDVVDAEDFSGAAELADVHGTMVAGLIAGAERKNDKLTGMAPGAEIVDVRVYEKPEDTTGEGGVDVDRVVAGLQWVAREADRLGPRLVVNVSLALARTPALRRVIEELRDQDAIVVAASGNRPQEGEDLYEELGVPQAGQDAFDDIFPAGFADDVVAVNATDGGVSEDEPIDLLQAVLPNSATDVAVPTNGGVSHALNGSPCVVTGVATSWAAAEVSGLVAMLWSWFPEATDEQIIARLLATADGTAVGRTTLTGAGVVQPVEAMTRELVVRRDGSIERTPVEGSQIPRATAPDPPVDPLEFVRERAVWWGLLGGGALVLALLLRPLLARRRD